MISANFPFSSQIFVQADNVGVLNSAEEKLGWIFTAFDADGGGSIDVEEIRLGQDGGGKIEYFLALIVL